MGRERKRKLSKIKNKKDAKPLYSLHDVQRAMNIAIEMRKLTKGHLFSKTSVDKKKDNVCVFCGKTVKVKTMCDFWFLTFLDRMQVVLINPNYFTDQEIEALWIQNGDDYKDVKVPLNVTKKD